MSINKFFFTVMTMFFAASTLPACENKVPPRKPFAEADNLICPPKTKRVEDKSSSYPEFYCVGFDGREGQYLEFDPNGRIRVSAEYKHDKMNGTWKSYHPRGTIETSGQMVDGKRHGVWTQYFVNGNRRSEKTYVEDVLSGPFKLFYNTGAIMAEGNNTDGYEFGRWTVYTPGGELARECQMVHGKEENCIIHIEDFQISSKFYHSSERGPL